jgi:hypothetical protein
MRSVICIATILSIASASRNRVQQEVPEPFGNDTSMISPVRALKGLSSFYQGYIEGLTK